MPKVQREDRSWLPLSLPQKTGEGFLIAEGYATRSGVFEYRNEDGSIRREWRPPSEVSDATSLESLKLKPVTTMHPPEPVTIENVAKYREGQVGDSVTAEWPDESQSDVMIRVRVIFDSATAIKDIEGKAATQFSCGYSADLEQVAGVTPQGEVYDAIQRNIIYNHLARVDVGRAGPNIGIRVDRADASQHKENKQMKKLILDGVGFDAPEQTVEAVNAHNAKQAAKLAEAVAAVDAATKRADQAEAKADAATAAEKAAEKAKADLAAKVAGMVKDRRALERAVAKVLPTDAFDALNLDELDDDALRAAVIKHVHADAVLEGKSSDYVRARFDLIVEQGAARTDAADGKKPDVKSAGTLRADTAEGSGRSDAAEKARQAAIEKQAKAYLPKI